MPQQSHQYSSFLIVHRRVDGTPDFVYPWTGRLFACLATCIYACRKMLHHFKVRSALVSFCREYRRSVRNAWFDDPRHGYSSDEDIVLDFIDRILAVFPTLYVDDALDNPKCLGGHLRGDWSDHFDPRKQSILLNGPRVRHLVSAGTRAAQTGDFNHDHAKEFRTFIFSYANMFLHEMAHVFVTFLTKGEAYTPVRMSAADYSRVQGMGEAGRNLETIIFGGTIEYRRDPNRGRDQSGIPHIVTRDGARRISQECIDATISWAQNIPFPYHLEGAFLKLAGMARMGDGWGETIDWTDTLHWPEMNEFFRRHHTVHLAPGSLAARLPFDPSLLPLAP